MITRTSNLESKGRTIHYQKGEYYPYLAGHSNRINQAPEAAQPFKIDGVYCRLIGLTQGEYAIIDASDYESLMKWKWSARWNKWTHSFYAIRSDRSEKGVHRTILMHRFIIDAHSPHVDHINGLSLDNRRKNLREATISQNCANRGPTVENKSGYKGVHLRPPPTKPWVAKVGGKLVGYFRTAEDAAHAADKRALELYGEFAWLNFP